MKIKILPLAALALTLALASCCNTPSVTKLYGHIDEEGFDEVNIAVEKYGIDTIVPVNNGKFYIELPADPTEFGFAAAGYYYAYFILDGTRLDLNLSGEFTVASRSRKSIQNRYNDFEDQIIKKNNDFLTQVAALSDSSKSPADTTDTAASGEGTENKAETGTGTETYDSDFSDEAITEALFEEIYGNAVDDIVSYIEQILLDNRDNAISAIALNKLDGIIPDDQLTYFISLLSDEMQQSGFVTPLIRDIAERAEAETAE